MSLVTFFCVISNRARIYRLYWHGAKADTTTGATHGHARGWSSHLEIEGRLAQARARVQPQIHPDRRSVPLGGHVTVGRPTSWRSRQHSASRLSRLNDVAAVRYIRSIASRALEAA